MNQKKKKKSPKATNDIAISVKNVSKTFRIPHEKVTSLRGAAVSVFRDRSYEEFKALDNISFEVKKGEFFGIIGRNGSGKSTLLKVLAGIYKPDKGKVKIKGMISPFLELGIGFNPELSGRDNVYLNATVLGMTKKQIDEKFDSIVKFSELERFIDQKLKNYSSGMQVRLAFSVSIHANRDILLMDEVLAVGDSNFQSKCIREFTKYKELGRTVIIVTHDISVVERYCDRVMLLRSGKIVKVGKADEVVSQYTNDNMSDEEKKMHDTNSNSDNVGEKRNVAEITKIEFLNNRNEIENVFKTGDDIVVKVNFRVNKNKPKMNFGVSLFTIDKEYIFGTNTIFDGVDTNSILEKGYFCLKLKGVPMVSNVYYIRVVIAGDHFNIRYSEVFQSNNFRVLCYRKNEGVFYVEHEWQ